MKGERYYYNDVSIQPDILKGKVLEDLGSVDGAKENKLVLVYFWHAIELSKNFVIDIADEGG